VFGIAAFFFVYIYLPETKGATLEQIQQIFMQRNTKKKWKDATSVLSRLPWKN
jgi:hypothetical protein